MKRVNKTCLRINRRGASTLFLAIILSALVLIECIYLGIAGDIDRRLAYRRAMKLEIDTVLADYDRELFRTYGIYAFDINGVDKGVFDKVIRAQGIEPDGKMYIEGGACFETDDLRRAISVFYSYRASGIAFDSIYEMLSGMCDSVESDELQEKIESFTSSKAAKIFRKLLKGGKVVAGVLKQIGKLFDIDSLTEKMDDYKQLLSNINSMMDESPDYTGGFNIGSLSGFSGIIQDMYELKCDAAEFTDDHLFRTASSHYGAYNFDSALEDDTTINGREFGDLHDGNCADAEYILTGKPGDSAVSRTKLMIFPAVYLIDLVNIMRDQEKMTVIDGISEVLAAAVSILSAGTVSLPPAVYKAVILVLYAGVCAWQDMDSLMNGEKIDVFDIGETCSFSLGYRDFIFIYLHFIPTHKVLDRISDIFNRDYEGYCSSVKVVATYGRGTYTETATYALYG